MITHRLGLMCDGAIYELDFSLSKLIASFSCYLLLVLHSKLLPIYSLSSEIHSLLVPEQNHGLEHSLHLMPPQITSIAYISCVDFYNKRSTNNFLSAIYRKGFPQQPYWLYIHCIGIYIT